MSGKGQHQQKSNKALKASAFAKFYKSAQGEVLNRDIARAFDGAFKKKVVSQCHFLGVGYPPPAMKKAFKKAKSLGFFFPAGISPETLSIKSLNVSAAIDEGHLPLRPGSYDAALIFHALENMEDPVTFLEELWRALSPGARITVMVPNKKAGWKKSGVPFSPSTRPFVFREARDMLQNAGFTITHSFGVLFGLPLGVLKTVLLSRLIKTLSGGSIAGLPGFIIFEAEKTSGPRKVKFKDPLKAGQRVKTAPKLSPE